MNIEKLVTFNPKKLRNLAVIQEIENLGTITDFVCEDLLREGSAQIFATCG